MTEGAKYDRGIANIGEVGEHDFQNGEVFNHWSGDGSDEEENSSSEEEEGANMVESPSSVSRHPACSSGSLDTTVSMAASDGAVRNCDG